MNDDRRIVNPVPRDYFVVYKCDSCGTETDPITEYQTVPQGWLYLGVDELSNLAANQRHSDLIYCPGCAAKVANAMNVEFPSRKTEPFS